MGDRWSVKGAGHAEDTGWLEYEVVAGEVGRDGRGARASLREPLDPVALRTWMSPHTSESRSAFALCRGGVVGFEVACVGRAELCPDRGIEGNRFCEAGWP
jgi:hypothetical protein